MTAFETATLAFQTATLAFQEAQLALQAWQLWAALAIPAVGIVQTAVVAWGIRAMIRANNRRAETDQRRAEADQRRADAEVARHAESMEALRAIIQGLEVVIERTGGRA